MLSPVPAVLVSCGDQEDSNLCTVAWTGIINSKPPKTYISLRPSRFSHEIIKKTGEFCINMPSSDLVRAVDYCGVKSGRDLNKFKEMNLTPEKTENLSCPGIKECPITLECKVTDILTLGSHDMFLADIVSVAVREDLIDDTGRLRLDKVGLFAYAHGTYYLLGKRIGTFGYSVKKKKPKPKRTN